MAVTQSGTFHCPFDPMHPEANAAALFLPVWYEGYPEALHMWQSSSATDDFEPKLGLFPLIFGTIKATFYAMLFGAPLALLAALFSSEFLHPRIKAAVKPTVELMASLPSVVLGFLAALVFAPFIEKVVPATLCVFVSVPFAFLLFAYFWQLLPVKWTRRRNKWKPLFFVLPGVAGVLIAWIMGPAIEKLFFYGDFKSWVSWDPGMASGDRFLSTVGGWMFLCLPLAALITALLNARYVTPRVRDASSVMERRSMALIDISRFGGLIVVTVCLAWLFSLGLDRLGFEIRGDWMFLATDFAPLDIYVQRNALIVGFVMGFAIIPIIYTIADDALSSVPDHLRSASLGAGATPWQTAYRIVIPTAMSGLFSALMIGLGRAVGETMIVLMALGNTPIMDWNIFNGARTLSANIAVELPEAVRNSTHYRTLFLAALVLFAMTFVVNTIAELVRLRFRKRAYQL
jgi:phosphate transport system permease protein